jgi:hypothetical protein
MTDPPGSPTKETEDQMVQAAKTPTPERAAVVEWAARMGAITAEALAHRQRSSVASARARLAGAERARLLCSGRPLAGRPALYTATRAGLRACGPRGLEPCRVSASNAMHLITCAEVAASLERCYSDQRVLGERELRRDERDSGRALASAQLGRGPSSAQLLHRPDLVIWPDPPADRLPVAVEVELTSKAPRRLAEICRAWARCRCVAGVLYLVSPEAEHALRRAIAVAQAGERIAVVPLAALAGSREGPEGSLDSTVPADT